jgi:NAD(P)-dependent dehydrogenase (short-subunit alcohol dehydrogenase family)
MDKGRLQGRVAMITGGSRGIGKATAVKMVREGASVVLLDILSKEVSQTARELRAMGGKALAIHADVAQKKKRGGEGG